MTSANFSGNLRREVRTFVPKCAMETTIAAGKIPRQILFGRVKKMYLKYPLPQIEWGSG